MDVKHTSQELVNEKGDNKVDYSFKEVQEDICKFANKMEEKESTGVIFVLCDADIKETDNGSHVTAKPSVILGGNIVSQIIGAAAVIDSLSESLGKTQEETIEIIKSFTSGAKEDGGLVN